MTALLAPELGHTSDSVIGRMILQMDPSLEPKKSPKKPASHNQRA